MPAFLVSVPFVAIRMVFARILSALLSLVLKQHVNKRQAEGHG